MIIKESDDMSQTFKLSFDRLGELFWGTVILTKISEIVEKDLVHITIGMSDIFFPNEIEDATLLQEVRLPKLKPMQKNLSDLITLISGEKAAEEFFGKADAVEKKRMSEYFSPLIKNALYHLKEGDSSGITKPCIDDYTIDDYDSLGIPIYNITVSPDKFIKNLKETALNSIFIHESAFKKLSESYKLSDPGISIKKELDFLQNHISHRIERTGEVEFAFSLKDINFRKVLIAIQGDSGKGVIPSPMTPSANIKSYLPLLLAIQGELDIVGLKIQSAVSNIEDVCLQFSVSKPAKKNVFGSEFCLLPTNIRERMSVIEINEYEKVVKKLQENYCFYKYPKLEKDFVEFSSWIIRKVTYCLEEPSFLKQKANEWIEEHNDESYQRMEDDMFLPFIYERLRDDFGNKVLKKPERFGGNVDILFGDLPIELKVRKGSSEILTDDIVNEKYKPTSQAAAYAALTRLGCVVVLDIMSKKTAVTNISSCIKVVMRNFPEAEFSTAIPVFIFQCNTPTPSRAS